MKGNAKIIKMLNTLLADELTAINQYMVHSEMCDDWGYGKLHKSKSFFGSFRLGDIACRGDHRHRATGVISNDIGGAAFR